MAATNPYHKPEGIRPMLAGATIPKWTIVIIGTTEDHVIVGAAIRDTQIVGIALNDATVGQSVEVATAGHCKLLVNSTSTNIAVGDSIMVQASTGYGGKVVSGGAGNVEAIGFANNASSADGDIISVRISKHLVYAAS